METCPAAPFQLDRKLKLAKENPRVGECWVAFKKCWFSNLSFRGFFVVVVSVLFRFFFNSVFEQHNADEKQAKSRPWGERRKAGITLKEKEGAHISPSLSLRKKILRENSQVPVPARTFGGCAQFRPQYYSRGRGHLPASSAHTQTQVHSAPALLSPRPCSPASWQTEARKLSIPIAFRPCSPIKEGLLVKGRPLFPKHGKKKGGGGHAQIGAGQVSLTRVFKELWMSLTKEVCG